MEPKPESKKFVLTCPGCQKRFQLLDGSILGKRVTCKSCKAPFLVDGGVLTEVAEKDLPKPKEPIKQQAHIEQQFLPALSTIIKQPFLDSTLKAILGTFLKISLLLIPIFAGVCTELKSNAAYFLGMWTCQLALVLIPIVFRAKRTWVVAVACAVPFLWIYTARNAQSMTFWKAKDGTSYTDTCWRWNGAITYRSYHGKDFMKDLHCEGGMSESNKPHGKWKYTCFEPFWKKEVWYWYGEEITEGEWHLRNK